MAAVKLFTPVIHLARWVAGFPPRNPPSRIIRWFYRLALVALLVVLVWFLLLGPGVLLMPFSPPGFQSTADETNTVFYEQDDEKAREVLRLAREAQKAILDFWGRPGGIEIFQGTKIYLGETPEAYFRLTGNHAGGSALFGNVIVINVARVGEVLSLVDFMKHELVKALSHAARRVASNPRHTSKGEL